MSWQEQDETTPGGETRPSLNQPEQPLVDPNAETQAFSEASIEKTNPVRINPPAAPDAQTQAYVPPAGSYPPPLDANDATQVNLPGAGWNNDQTRPSLPYTYPEPFGYPEYPYPAQPAPEEPAYSGRGGYTQPYSAADYSAPPPTPQYPAPDPMGQYQPIAVAQPARAPKKAKPKRARRSGCGLGCGCLPLLIVLLVGLAYFLAPLSTRILVLGADRPPEGTNLSRTDTIILVSVNPLLPDVRLLSIPRDLWINIPGVGENRINTVHFFAENNQPGSGPSTTAQVVADTFGLGSTPYYTRLRFDGVVGIVDAMGGVDVNMPEAMSGYEAGWNHLTGEQALAFSRDRSGADDFFRMAHGQLLIKSVIQQMLKPATWVRLPQVIQAGLAMVDTNIPAWQWPRLGVALARAVIFGGLDSRTFDRDMATPYVTADGAQVLLPQWDLIRPVLREMFGAG